MTRSDGIAGRQTPDEEWSAALDAWEVWIGHAQDVFVSRAPVLPPPPAFPTCGAPPESQAVRAHALLASIDRVRAQGAALLGGETRAGLAYSDAAR